ncbi:hypothetical protein J2X72_005068 [Phyllobacterium sp. 1468]|nr:hypothetical protein [Phyllobacterium sp. 1468]
MVHAAVFCHPQERLALARKAFPSRLSRRILFALPWAGLTSGIFLGLCIPQIRKTDAFGACLPVGKVTGLEQVTRTDP